ncbi:hypothetical protein Taro_049624 [Colocasia esculenta]|uniref:Uncharacterized protein n=1 Tax=Colocasia esculenta TaxID=4460 RepID=A0A843XBA6_COLES|nr:hypothetical protein [Colocasia esculenta]
MTPTVVTSLVGCPRFSVSQFTASVPVFLVCSVLGEFPTESVTREAHPYPPPLPQVRARRTFRYRHPVRSRVVAVLDQHLQQCIYLGVCPRLLYFLVLLLKFGYVNLVHYI